MVIVYWGLTVFWLVAVVLLASSFYSNQLFTRKINRLTKGFLVLASLLLIDSIYWSIANMGRVGIVTDRVAIALYNPYWIAAVKSLFLVAAVVFMYMTRRRLIMLQRDAELLYFTRFVEQSTDAIGVLDATGQMRYWNTGAERLYGHRREDVIGKNIKEFLIPRHLHESMDAKFAEIRKSMRPSRFRAPRLKADGSTIEVELTISPFLLEDDAFGGFFGIMRAVDPLVIPRGPHWTGRRLKLVMATTKNEVCKVHVEYENVVSANDAAISIPLALDYILSTEDDKVVEITGMKCTSRPDASVSLDPRFEGGQSYRGACKFDTGTKGPVDVILEFEVTNNFCANARVLRERWGLDGNLEPLDWYAWHLDMAWDEVVIEFHWPENFRFAGTPWLMWRDKRQQPELIAVPSSVYSMTVTDRVWTFVVTDVTPATTLIPTWRLDEPPDPAAVLTDV